MNNMERLQSRIVIWRNKQLDASLSGTVEHLREEVEHLASNPYDPFALADVYILLLSVTDYAGFSVEQMEEAIAAKQTINEQREWLSRDIKGVVRHK